MSEEILQAFFEKIKIKTGRLSTLGYVGSENQHWDAVRRLECHLLHLLDYFLPHFPPL